VNGVGNVCGVLLAGGQSRRMGGGDKSLRMFDGAPLLERIIATADPQVSALCLNSNGDPAEYGAFGLPVVPDGVAGHAGPLAGILAGMEWVRNNHADCDWLASFACDAPFIPADLVLRLLAGVCEGGADLACARSGDRMHPVIGLWPMRLHRLLDQAVREEGVRKVDRWTAHYRLVAVEWSVDPVDPFFNVNSPEDFAEAERLVVENGL